jgi:hypothetical protein
MKTMIVVTMVSFRVGHVTFAVSARTCCINSNGLVFAILEFKNLCDLRRHAALQSIEPNRPPEPPLAGVEGLEPPTPGFGDRCSSRLSYTPSWSLRAAPPDNSTAHHAAIDFRIYRWR